MLKTHTGVACEDVVIRFSVGLQLLISLYTPHYECLTLIVAVIWPPTPLKKLKESLETQKVMEVGFDSCHIDTFKGIDRIVGMEMLTSCYRIWKRIIAGLGKMWKG